MLTLFTIKKILFFGTLGAGIFGPIIGTSPLIREFAWSSDVSPLKEGLYNLGLVDIYEGESIPKFFKKALLLKEGQEGLIESIAQELARKWYFSQPSHWTHKQKEAWRKLQEEQFKEAWEKLKPINVQRDFWDNYWGSRENMNSFWLRHNSYRLVKEFLTNFSKSDFTLNSGFTKKDEGYKNSGDLQTVFAKSHSISETELEKAENWDKIGFFPSASKAESQSEEWKQFVWGKYEFINWCYKYWFNKNLPTYFWKISWHYNKDATSSDLAKEYSKETLKGDFPEKTNYGFPIFSPSTTKKFQDFMKKIANIQNGTVGNSNGNSQSLQLDKYHVEGWHGDQVHSSTLLEVFNSFETVSPEYASVTSYLINKVLSGTTGTQPSTSGTSSTSGKINALKLESWKNGSGGNGGSGRTTNGDKKPISIFFDDNGTTNSGTETQNNQQVIAFDSKILVNGNGSGSKKHIYDLRETDSSNWIFFRDEQGVHAITLDGYLYLLNGKPNNGATKDSKEKLLNWFNFRNLQLNGSRRHFSVKKYLQVSEDWFAKFKEYFSKYFDRLLVEYYLKEGEKSLLFLHLKEKEYFNNFKELLTNLFTLIEESELNFKLFTLRKKIIEQYSSREWTLTGTDKKEPQSESKQGLVSPWPYEINLSDNDKEKGRFPQQENVFNKFLKSDNKSTQTATVAVQVNSTEPAQTPKESEYDKLFSKYHQSVNSLLENKKINLNIRSNGFDFQSSQRLFIFDSIFDYLLDKLFGNKDLLNYQVKEEKLLTSNLFGSNGLLKEKKDQKEDNLPWNAPISAEMKLDQLLSQNLMAITKVSEETKPSSTQDNGKCWSCESSILGDETKNKESRRSLLNALLKVYFFRSYLKKIGERYFNFLGDFPNTKKSTDQQQSQIQTEERGATHRFSFLTSDLFNHWRQSYLRDIKERENFLDFLITLNFLTKNNFAELKKALETELAVTTKYHYLFFDSVTGTTSGEEGKNKRIHPFLSGKKEGVDGNDFFENRNKAWTFLRESWKTHGELSLKTEGTTSGQAQQLSSPDNKKVAIFKEMFTEHSALPNKKHNLFNFTNLKGLLETIKHMASPADFERLVFLLSKIQDTIKAEFYRVDKVYLTNHQEKKIFLEEKKRLLAYQLLNTNEGAFYSSTVFDNNKENKIFKKSLDDFITELDKKENGKPSSTTGATTPVATSAPAPQTNGTNHHLDKKHFEREMGEMPGGYFIQVSAKDWNDDTSICNFFNLLPMDLLADFLAIQTDKPLNKENAKNNFFEKTLRLKPRDMKFKNHIDSKHLE
ncbi:hypothetical protein DNK47_00995 [Mycoplasma wenyonii]|uniref:Uncharacterized protein n=1 Tax=Mycoplasma wenyonii TaxID=65123 RepID=A0A328PQN0_9MOLU|nr:DUF3713 domain-containing protein [Mycoplasma wenyonii]RAO95188.1 hypothetical protein DNK47_00995 [Mycoplasma wenyonii]